MNLYNFTATVAMEAMYADYLNCHMWHTTEYGHPYDPKSREAFLKEYNNMLGLVIQCMNEEHNWEPPFTDAVTKHTRGLDLQKVYEAQGGPSGNPNQLPDLGKPQWRN